ncbi:MAG TPA: hypothetical protein VFH75_08145 [Actinomycetota bacterium]|nr:hypothetical protein [Actinomycetota bacterium]
MTRVRLLAIGGLAWSGVVLGHLLAYVLAHPAEAERSARLASSGHDSFPLLLISALAGIPAVLSLLAVRVIRGDRSPALLSIAICLAAIQVPTFLAMEFFERGMSLEQMLLEPAVVMGLAIQVLVALISSLLVRTFVRAVGALITRGSRLPREPRMRQLAPVTQDRPRRLYFLISDQHRAPPLAHAS